MKSFSEQYKLFKNEIFHKNLQLIAIVLIFLLGHNFLTALLATNGLTEYIFISSILVTTIYLVLYIRENNNKNKLIHSVFKEINYSTLTKDEEILVSDLSISYHIHYCRVLVEDRANNKNTPCLFITEDKIKEITSKLEQMKFDPKFATKATSIFVDLAILGIIAKK